jgi:adenosylcobinamide hydrolase
MLGRPPGGHLPYRRRVPFKPILTARQEDGESIPLLVWRLPAPMRGISSAPLGGGIGTRRWVVNATVPMSYARADPQTHLAALAGDLGLDGPGVGLLTGVDVAQRVAAVDGAAEVWATVGLGQPIVAAAKRPIPRQHTPGTINIVAFVPVRLSDAALVNAVATITEAKAQALWELGLAATGTATDAVTVLCPVDGAAEPYGGPLSRWGARLARAAHRAVREGGARPKIPWSER